MSTQLSDESSTARALQASELRYRRLFESAKDGILILDAETGMVMDVNPFLIELLGLSREAFLGKKVWQLGFLKDIAASEDKFAELQAKDYIRYEDLPLQAADGRRIDVEFVSNAYLVDQQRVIQCNIRDISKRKQAERQAQLIADVLAVLNRPNDTKLIIGDIMRRIKEHTGIEAVGVRLKKGDDFPYYETNGFPERFVQMENHLCATDAAGTTLHDEHGHTLLECMCGNVIRGRTDAMHPFFTAGGSFWTNSTSDLLASTTEADRQAHTRNRCHGEGYESVALIPLRAGGETIGLLQFNDHRRNRFTPAVITYFESLGDSVGIALSRMQSREALLESRELLQAVLNSIPVRVFWKDRNLVYLGCNAPFARDAGFDKPADIVGKDDRDMSWREQAEGYRADDRAVIASGEPKLLIEEVYTTVSGARVPILTSKVPLRDSNGAIVGVLGAY